VYKTVFSDGEVTLQRLKFEGSSETKGVIYTKFVEDEKTAGAKILTFSNNGSVRILKIDHIEDIVTIHEQMQIEEHTEDDDMYDSDEEDEKYLKSLTNFYYSVCSSERYLAY